MSASDDMVDELTLRARKRVGATLREKWRLDELLGVGGMAAVYAATHRNGKRVAIKVLHREAAMSDDSRARFLREGYVANAIDHKGAVSVIDDDVTDDGAPFITMDLLHGETLDARVRRKGRLEPFEVLAAMHQLLDVLGAAHAKGIVHRDVKPENVFLTTTASVKVLDFGIAHVEELTARTGTQSGYSMGTPSFMPPEQARGRWEDVDARSDLWAVGATMFTLLTGRHVHEADTMNEVLLGAMSVHAKPVSLYRPELPESVCAVVDRAVAFDRDARWQTAAEMQTAIREAYDALKEAEGDLERDLTREPTLVATLVPSAKAAALAPVLNLATMTTGTPTTRTAGEEKTPPPARAPNLDRRFKVAAVAVAGGITLVAAFVVASNGSGTPSPAYVALADASSKALAAPSPSGTSASAETATSPAPPPTGAAIVTVQPSEPEPATREPVVKATPPPPSHAWHPHRSSAPTPAAAPAPPPTPPPPAASAAPDAPPAPPADPLNRRH